MNQNISIFIISFSIFSIFLLAIGITNGHLSEAFFSSFILFPTYALIYLSVVFLDKITSYIKVLSRVFKILVFLVAFSGLFLILSEFLQKREGKELVFNLMVGLVLISSAIPLYRHKLSNLTILAFGKEKVKSKNNKGYDNKKDLSKESNFKEKEDITKEKFSSDFALFQRLQSIDPYEFEKLVAEVLKAYFGEKAEVILTQSSRDQGIDIRINLHDDVLGGKYLVQVKRYRNNVGEPELKKFLGTIHDHRAKGIFVTLSGFSEPAKKLAKEHNITLIDGEKLIAMIKRYKIIEISEENQELAS